MTFFSRFICLISPSPVTYNSGILNDVQFPKHVILLNCPITHLSHFVHGNHLGSQAHCSSYAEGPGFWFSGFAPLVLKDVHYNQWLQMISMYACITLWGPLLYLCLSISGGGGCGHIVFSLTATLSNAFPRLPPLVLQLPSLFCPQTPHRLWSARAQTPGGVKPSFSWANIICQQLCDPTTHSCCFGKSSHYFLSCMYV